MILPIYVYGQPVLRKVAEDITPDYPNLKELIANMFETMVHADGVGLAAPQIGLPIRVVTITLDPLSEEYPEVILYQDTSYSLDHLYSLSSTIEKALSKKVWLKSGGTLIIEPTEALTVIDVNTGKAIQGKRNKETTFYKVNLEAAREAARQIRLRNLSGMILIDFIDMEEEEHIKSLIYNFKKELEQDPTQCTFIDITKLGLVELTRRKTHLSLPECLKQE